MNYDILNMVLAMTSGALAMLALFAVWRRDKTTAKKENLVCGKCGSSKINPLTGTPGTYWCFKCGYQFSVNQPAPQPIVEPTPKPVEEVKQFIHICKHCAKEFNDEKKLRRHIGMAHLDKIEI